MTTTLERDIEKKLRKGVEAQGGRCLKWTCPGWRGVPDRIVLLPKARIFFVETKRPKGGKLSAMQKKWREWLTALGFSWWAVWDEEDLTTFLEHIKVKTEDLDCFNCKHTEQRPQDEPCRSCENVDGVPDKWEAEE